MQTCSRCKIQIRGRKTACPLCGAPLSGTPEPSPFPVFRRTGPTRQMIWRTALFAMIAIEIVMLVIHYLVGYFFSWMPIVMLSALIGFADICFTLYYRNNAVKSIHVQIYIGILICLLADWFTGWHRWSASWAVPSAFLGLIVGTILTGVGLHMVLQDFVLYILLDTGLSAIQILFLYLGWNSFPPYAIFGMTAEVLFFIGILIFRWRDFKSASERYFNV